MREDIRDSLYDLRTIAVTHVDDVLDVVQSKLNHIGNVLADPELNTPDPVGLVPGAISLKAYLDILTNVMYATKSDEKKKLIEA